MKKQGFTLIELMVVIVIMGILAAVAVPKLFGMIAKSKASEVGPAAGTYVKLQQAYYSEASTVGGWTLIGYAAPNDGATTNFYYGYGAIDLTNSTNVTTSTVAWQAANKTNLNECTAPTGVSAGKTQLANANWTISVAQKSDNTNDITFTASAGSSGCEALTPTFKNIGQ